MGGGNQGKEEVLGNRVERWGEEEEEEEVEGGGGEGGGG